MVKELFDGDENVLFFLSTVQSTEVREILFYGSREKDSRIATPKKKNEKDIVNDKLPAAAFLCLSILL